MITDAPLTKIYRDNLEIIHYPLSVEKSLSLTPAHADKLLFCFIFTFFFLSFSHPVPAPLLEFPAS